MAQKCIKTVEKKASSVSLLLSVSFDQPVNMVKIIFAFVLFIASTFALPKVPSYLPYAIYENDGLERELTPYDRKKCEISHST